MIKRIVFSVILLMSYVCAFPQAPQAINYQAIARDANGTVLIEKQVSIKLAILRGSANGTVIYEETHTAISGKTGVVNLQIGKGTAVTGTFANTDWSQSPYFIRFSMDVNGGTNYKEVATTQMLSVPYALYAETAGTVNGVTPSANQDFLVFSDTDAQLFAGNNPEYEYGNSFFIRGSVIYLNNEDQEVNFKVEGLPENVIVDSSDPSGKYGRYINFDLDTLPYDGATYNCNLVLTNKYGVSKKFPFTLKVLGLPDEKIEKEKEEILDLYKAFFDMSRKIDNAFMNKKTESGFEIFRDKTYHAASPQVYEYWKLGFEIIERVNQLIKSVPINDHSRSDRINTIALISFTRGYSYLKLIEWFRYIPFKFQYSFSGNVFRNQSDMRGSLSDISTDFYGAVDILSEDNYSELTPDFLLEKLCELYLFGSQWSSVINMRESSLLLNYYKELAEWKIANTPRSFSSLDKPEVYFITEYEHKYYHNNNQGNLLLNVLDYSAEYFGWDEREAYKAILPIPQSELERDPNLEQNPGY